MADAGIEIDHPNREKTASKATRAVVVLLLLASALVMIVITIGAWDVLVGAKGVQILYILLYLGIAYLVTRWSRGVLPVAAALAIVLLIFAAVSAPAWFDRDQPGFAEPTLDAGVLGLVTALIVPVQLLLIAFAMSGFRQAWNVEIEHPVDEPPPERRGRGGPAPAAA